MSSIIDRIHNDEEEYWELCEKLGVKSVHPQDNFYKHFEELKAQIKENSNDTGK